MIKIDKDKFRLLMRYGLAIGVIIMLSFHIQKQQNLLGMIQQFNLLLLMPVILLFLVHFATLYNLWRDLLLDTGGVKTTEYQIYHSFIGGRTLGFLTPGQIGELGRGVFFGKGSRTLITSLNMVYIG